MNPRHLFTTSKPPELHKFIGRTVLIPEFCVLDGKRVKLAEEKVMIVTLCGNRFKPQFYEINGTHLIGMLRFHAQMTGAKDITEEQFQQFEDMELTAKKVKEK